MSSQSFNKVTHVDGLLLDTEPRYAKTQSAMCLKYGCEFTQEAKIKVMGRTGRESAEILIDHFNLPVTLEKYLQEIEELYEGVFEEYIPFFPGAEELVKHLHQHNIPMCIASSSKYARFKMKAKHHPEFFQLFDHIVTGTDDPEVRKGKPAPDIFNVAAKRFKEPPKEMKNVLIIEDSENGVKAANAAEMQVVWVPAPETDTTTVQATLILPSLEKFNPELFGLPPYKDR